MPTPFHDLDAYIALPRLSGLQLSPDGTRLVTTVSTLDPQRTKHVSALWEVDPSGAAPARRLTRSAKGESAARFTADGDLLFTSARPDPESTDDDAPSALWLLPAAGGEARVLATRHAGIDGVLTADAAPVAAILSEVLPSAVDEADDDRLRRLRKDHKVAAILHDSYPVRYWDHDLGPSVPHLFTLDSSTEDRAELRDVTPDPGIGLRHQDAVLSADGRTAVTSWTVPGPKGALRQILVRIDLSTGERNTLVDDPAADLSSAAISPDGALVAYLRETVSTPHQAPRVELWLTDLDATGEPRRLAADWDRWPGHLTWTRDGAGLLIEADDLGRGPVFHLDLATEAITRVTADDAVFTDLQLSPDGRTLYALRSSYLAPAHPVRIDLAGALASGPVEAVALPAPAPLPELPGTLTEVTATAEDGSALRSWLVLPEGADATTPAPLLLWIHGGPLGSWNTWSWRWNPWILAARGYAVLLPDPALSTGYGQDFIQRGWGAWGAAPFTDLMALTDVAVARSDIDETRTAAMGGSFGGYMANWVAGHTDRFRGIVTHASLWALDQFGPTTDDSFYWAREMTPQMALDNSPHLSVEQIVTPMLVIHGDKDYRVPIGEGLRLWYELLSRSGLPADDQGRTPHRFLYFPDENHWILTPQHAKVWYQVVERFLAEHVLGLTGEELPTLPEELG
ncbi:S9 family peptidase [Cellulomonas sp. NPDC089187]|uniref:S9 family peptidase n=1 Tax=Cellulomonas sp. NPDC089187 TaxID=3154970 RepID=UPI00342BF47B